MVGPVHKTVAFQLFQRQAQHALRDAKVAFEFIESQRSVFRQGNHDKHTLPVTDAGQNLVDAFAVGAAAVVQHGGSLYVTGVQTCAFLWLKLVPLR